MWPLGWMDEAEDEIWVTWIDFSLFFFIFFSLLLVLLPFTLAGAGQNASLTESSPRDARRCAPAAADCVCGPLLSIYLFIYFFFYLLFFLSLFPSPFSSWIRSRWSDWGDHWRPMATHGDPQRPMATFFFWKPYSSWFSKTIRFFYRDCIWFRWCDWGDHWRPTATNGDQWRPLFYRVPFGFQRRRLFAFFLYRNGIGFRWCDWGDCWRPTATNGDQWRPGIAIFLVKQIFFQNWGESPWPLPLPISHPTPPLRRHPKDKKKQQGNKWNGK